MSLPAPAPAAAVVEAAPPIRTPGSNAPALPGLSRQQKATIIVRLLQSEGIDLSLTDLPDELQVAIAQEMGKMKYVTRSTLTSVVSEFVHELDALGLSFPRGVPGTLSALEPSLSETAAAQLRDLVSNHGPKDPWDQISELDIEKLLPVLEVESIEICAVALSKLHVGKAAEIMGILPGERARRIAFTMSRTDAIAPATVKRIGTTLLAQLQNVRESAFDGGPADRVGSILNFARASTRDDVLAGLMDEDQSFGAAVKKAIFTFADIPGRLDARDVPKITREVDGDTLIIALKAASALEAEALAMDFILENISQRMAGNFRDEMEGLDAVKESDGEDAMTAVVAAIRGLQENGEIELVTPEEEDA